MIYIKRSFVFVIAAVIILCGCTGNAYKKTEYKLDESNAKMSEKLLDTTVAIDGKVISFPLEYKEFTNTGYGLADSSKDKKLKHSQYGVFDIKSKEKTTAAYFGNLEDGEMELSLCTVCGIEADAKDDITVELPKKITVGVSKYEDIINAYGNPDSEENTAEFDKCLKYGKGNNAALLYIKDDILERAGVFNVKKPTIDAVSEEVPEYVKDYKSPKELSDKLSDMTFYLYGHNYKMPVPVKELIDDGFICVGKTVKYVGAWETEKDAIKLVCQNRTLTFSVKNLADYPTAIENCVITSITSKYSVKLDLTLANGCRVGSTAANLESTFGKKNFTSIVKDEERTVYTYVGNDAKLTVKSKNDSGYIYKITFELQ